ncbi:Olfactory receptor 8H1, partial [Heterocephalus glaber]
NSTSVPGFILMGLTDSAETQLVLSMLFLLIYLITVLGNVGMILIIHLDPQLHTPMYFFLTHLSFLDLSYSSVTTPKTLQNLLTSTKNISFMGCFTQMFFFIVFVAAECFLLSSMAYDRYVAICRPLHYPVIMSKRLCHALLTGSYVIGFVDSTMVTVFMNRLHFCNSNVIQHFFCDSSPILALSCSDTFEVEIIILIFAGFTLVLRNSTSVPGFILMGLTDSTETQLVLSMLFLLIYLITVLGNTGMILIIRLDPQLHTPMYFFLTHLSFLDLSYSSVFTPKTLQNLLTFTKSISFLGCLTQMFFFVLLGGTECFLL